VPSAAYSACRTTKILYRRIGSNELNVINICTAIYDAQRDYYAALHDDASAHQYAQRSRSSAETHDGLFWKVEAGSQTESPLGPLVAEAASEGYQHHSAAPPSTFLWLHIPDSYQSRVRCTGWR
jgi:hypothetical protein